MSNSLKRYFNHQCSLLLHGYARINAYIIIIEDICFSCTKYLLYPDAGIIDNTLIQMESQYFPNILEYLLLTQVLQSLPTSHTVYTVILSKPWSWKKWKSLRSDGNAMYLLDKYVNDKNVAKSLSFCIRWSIQVRGNFFIDYTYHDLVHLYVDTMIELAIKGVVIKYPLMKSLITMYENYYMVLSLIQMKDKKRFKYSILKKQLQQKLLNARVDDGCIEGKFNQWIVSYSQKMSSMLQSIMREYVDVNDRVMQELNDIINIIKAKYDIINNHSYNQLR